MKTAILTDTNSGITTEEGRQMGISILPMPVIIDEKSYLEGINITNCELYEALKKGRNVSSSQPSPGDVMNMWDQILEGGSDALVYIPMSSGLSGSCHNAIRLAEEYGGKVLVADNHRISLPLKESVFDAKKLADEGCSAREIKEYLEKTAYETSIYVSVDSLKYLKKSGRITASAAAIANMLHIKPVLSIRGEKLDLFARVRGSKQSERRMIEALKADLESRFASVPAVRLRIDTAGTFEREEDAQYWCRMVQAAFPDFHVNYTPLSCSIACHVGVNAAGTAITVVK